MRNPIAFVLLENAVTPNTRELVDAMRQRHPNLAWDVAGGAATPNDSPLIRCGKQIVAIMSIRSPLPHDEGLWTRAAMLWPEGRQLAGRHRAHLIVSTMGTNENKVDGARVTTAVVGGLIAITRGCSAVVWQAKVARSAQTWLDMSRRAFRPFPDYPFTLWVDIVPFPCGQTIGAITVGLSSFLDREIEFQMDGMDRSAVINRVSGLAVYLMEHGAVIKDGDTMGVSESDRIKAHYRTSRFTGAPVITVGSDRSAPDRLQYYPIIPASIARDHPLLVMLAKVGLFDPSAPINQIQLRPDAYVSQVRLESYDEGMNGVLSKILRTDAYAGADKKARHALARGDVEAAKSTLMPFAEEIRKFLMTARYALTTGHMFMFPPR
jgi:hypothetical protein